MNLFHEMAAVGAVCLYKGCKSFAVPFLRLSQDFKTPLSISGQRIVKETGVAVEEIAIAVHAEVNNRPLLVNGNCKIET